jgi:hypothetical protein
MLVIRVGQTEDYDEATSQFIKTGGTALTLEHSLVSLSKWESKHEKPFLSPDEKSTEEVFSYVRCMIRGSEVPPEVFAQVSEANLEEINEYINAKMTATTFRDMPQRGRPEIITAEVIYYWMVSFNIPFECEHWHLNRLFTLIRVCGVKNSKPKAMSRSEAAAQQRELNAMRRAQLGTKG